MERRQAQDKEEEDLDEKVEVQTIGLKRGAAFSTGCGNGQQKRAPDSFIIENNCQADYKRSNEQQLRFELSDDGVILPSASSVKRAREGKLPRRCLSADAIKKLHKDGGWGRQCNRGLVSSPPDSDSPFGANSQPNPEQSSLATTVSTGTSERTNAGMYGMLKPIPVVPENAANLRAIAKELSERNSPKEMNSRKRIPARNADGAKDGKAQLGDLETLSKSHFCFDSSCISGKLHGWSGPKVAAKPKILSQLMQSDYSAERSSIPPQTTSNSAFSKTDWTENEFARRLVRGRPQGSFVTRRIRRRAIFRRRDLGEAERAAVFKRIAEATSIKHGLSRIPEEGKPPNTNAFPAKRLSLGGD
ncbi:hypothetical protein WN51_10826 [Melipona quadrifasciata]|uniref:Uncharacterized protein n=1 Tax=Melipona quadrifasciata TaxID=166423 RepID=A0A0M9A4B6_9HYME|nr:hypothetical protein WN51_10826 [Melipona quadrifasciata]